MLAKIRYELEYDENRLEIGWDIARRFLGIECSLNSISDTRNEKNDNDADTIGGNEKKLCQESGTVDCKETSATLTPAVDINVNKAGTNVNATTTANTTTVTVRKTSKNSSNTDAGADSIVGKMNENNKDTSKKENLECGKEELVLDILNDDLIGKVRAKIPCKFLN